MDVYPLIFKPIFKPKIWGGRRLATLVDKALTPGTRVKIEVFDKDGLSDDPIGTMVILVPQKPGSFSARSGQVNKLSYVFE